MPKSSSYLSDREEIEGKCYLAAFAARIARTYDYVDIPRSQRPTATVSRCEGVYVVRSEILHILAQGFTVRAAVWAFLQENARRVLARQDNHLPCSRTMYWYFSQDPRYQGPIDRAACARTEHEYRVWQDEVNGRVGRGDQRRAAKVGRSQRRFILDRDGHCCVNCGETEQLRIDHRISVVQGGTNHDDNLQTLCAICNAVKGTHGPDYLRSVEGVAGLRRHVLRTKGESGEMAALARRIGHRLGPADPP